MNPIIKYAFLKTLPRGVGHTTAALGLRPVDRILIVGSQREASMLQRQHSVTCMTPDRMIQLHGGDQRPLVMDIEAVRIMAGEYEEELARVQSKLDKIRDVLGDDG